MEIGFQKTTRELSFSEEEDVPWFGLPKIRAMRVERWLSSNFPKQMARMPIFKVGTRSFLSIKYSLGQMEH